MDNNLIVITINAAALVLIAYGMRVNITTKIKEDIVALQISIAKLQEKVKNLAK